VFGTRVSMFEEGTFHSTGGVLHALSFLFIVNIVLIYMIRVRIMVRDRVSLRVRVSVG